MLSEIKRYLLLLRPYTVINIAIISSLPAILTSSTLGITVFRDILIGILIWSMIILGKEIFHEETDQRGKINKKVPFAIGLILVGILVYLNIYALFILVVSLIAFLLYSSKNRDLISSPISFFFRGFLEVSILLIIFIFYLPIYSVIQNYFWLLLSVFILTDSRNIIGDLRDQKKDEYTLPKKIGETASLSISLLLLVAVVMINRIEVGFPLFVTAVSMLLTKNYYLLHKIYVIGSGFFFLNIISYFTLGSTLLVNVCFLVSLLNLSYDSVPREVVKIEKQNTILKKSRIQDLLTLVSKIVLDSRFRRDLKALKIAKIGYTRYAWELLEELGITKLLSKGASLTEIKRQGIKDDILLEYLLDLLTGSGNLSFSGEKYFLVKPPSTLTKEQLEYMKQNYPASFEWTFLMVERAKKTLKKGKRSALSGFDDKIGANLWDRLMQESPHSFRKIAIRKFVKGVKKKTSILDIGCGTGASLFGILEEVKGPVFISGTDTSKKSLEIAKMKIRRRILKAKTDVEKQNLRNTKLFLHNFLDGPTAHKYDYIFLSFVINHIPRKKRVTFYRNIRDSLKEQGECVIYQLVNKSKFERVPMWVMHNVPTHQEYPFLEDYLKDLKAVFSQITTSFGGLITKLKK